MAILFNEGSSIQAWKRVSSELLLTNHLKNIIIEINNPCDFSDLDGIISKHNPALITGKAGNDDIRNVINTIFPYKCASKFNDRQDFFSHYRMVHARARKIRPQKWGTYFERLIDYPKSNLNNTKLNQLDNAINALNSKSTCKNYINFHLSSVNIESNIRPLGAPCWQFGQIIINDDKSLDLIAVYRNHDYFKKTLGNIIGLSKLLEYICVETNRQPNLLTIHSINAFYNVSRSKFRDLINGM